MVALVAVVALAWPASSLAEPPLLDYVAVSPTTNEPTYAWLPAAWEAESQFLEVATDPAVSLFGHFYQAALVNFEVLDPDQADFTDGFPYAPGLYYVHIAGHDPFCEGADCPLIEFSDIACFEVPPLAPGSPPCENQLEPVLPETNIYAPPPSHTLDTTPTVGFDSDLPLAYFECRLDEQPFEECESPHTTAALPAGPHTFDVRAVRIPGLEDPTPASTVFTIVAPPVVGVAAPTKQASGGVVVSSKRLRMSRTRRVTVEIACRAPATCSGIVVLKTVKRGLRLGSARYSLASQATGKVRVRLSRRRARLVKRLKRLDVRIRVTSAEATTTRIVTLGA